MDKLLKWSLGAEQGQDVRPPTAQQLRALFDTGPDDPTLMKQSIAVLHHPEASLETKEVAFDNFEMLIEQLDNANNIGNMKMWPAIVEQMDLAEPTLRTRAASVVGVAVQNNPDSQKAFTESGGIAKLVQLATDEYEPCRLKAVLALAGVVRWNLAGLQAAVGSGWAVVAQALQSSERFQMRGLSLAAALLSQDEQVESNWEGVRENGIVAKAGAVPEDLAHRAIHLLALLIKGGYKFSDEELAVVKSIATSHEDTEPVDKETVTMFLKVESIKRK